MTWIGFTLLGLIVGAISRRILPGRGRGGCVTSLIVGVLGAHLGGWIGMAAFKVPLGDFFEIRTWLLALMGTVALLIVFRLITGRLR